MKKIILIAAMALLSISGFAQKVGRVSYEELMYLMPDYMEAQRTLAAVNKETSETYQAMVSEYQTKRQAFDQKQASYTESVRQSKQAELADIERRLQEFQQMAYQEIQEKQNELIAPIREKAINAIRDLAKAQELLLVFDVNQLIYFDEANTVDLMPAARTALGIPEGRTLETVQEEISALQLQYAE